MRKSVLIITVIASTFLFVLTSNAATVELNLYTQFGSTSFLNPDNQPWLQATFDDHGSTGSVTLTLESNNLTGTGFVSEWYFNLDPGLNPDNLTINHISGIDAEIDQGTNAFRAAGDGRYDILFSFPRNGSEKFMSDLSSTWLLSCTECTTDLDANSFYFTSVFNRSYDPYYSAAHVQSIDLEGNGRRRPGQWIAADPPAVPIPPTVWIFGAGLIGLVGIRRKVRN